MREKEGVQFAAHAVPPPKNIAPVTIAIDDFEKLRLCERMATELCRDIDQTSSGCCICSKNASIAT
jgi:hypothetical protein